MKAKDVFQHIVNYIENNRPVDSADPKILAAELRENGFVENAMKAAEKEALGRTPKISGGKEVSEPGAQSLPKAQGQKREID